MTTLALDAATTSTSVALARADGWSSERHDEVATGARPQHVQLLLAFARELLAAGGLGWAEVSQVAVGVGPGSYTGLRIAAATARGIARAHDAALVGVSSLRALAEPLAGAATVAVLDARRGEAFVAVYRDEEELLAPRVCKPEELAGLAACGGPDSLAVGDGALRFRELLEFAGIAVEAPGSDRHRVSAAAICRLAARGVTCAPAPDYLRLADAEIALAARTR